MRLGANALVRRSFALCSMALRQARLGALLVAQLSDKQRSKEQWHTLRGTSLVGQLSDKRGATAPLAPNLGETLIFDYLFAYSLGLHYLCSLNDKRKDLWCH